jgi:hypothetical protein
MGSRRSGHICAVVDHDAGVRSVNRRDTSIHQSPQLGSWKIAFADLNQIDAGASRRADDLYQPIDRISPRREPKTIRYQTQYASSHQRWSGEL